MEERCAMLPARGVEGSRSVDGRDGTTAVTAVISGGTGFGIDGGHFMSPERSQRPASRSTSGITAPNASPGVMTYEMP